MAKKCNRKYFSYCLFYLLIFSGTRLPHAPTRRGRHGEAHAYGPLADIEPLSSTSYIALGDRHGHPLLLGGGSRLRSRNSPPRSRRPPTASVRSCPAQSGYPRGRLRECIEQQVTIRSPPDAPRRLSCLAPSVTPKRAISVRRAS